MHVAIYEQTSTRSKKLCAAMFEGFRNSKDSADVLPISSYSTGGLDYAWSIFYGQANGGKELLQKQGSRLRDVLYIDLGYWKRKIGSDQFGGHHKVAWNDIHPNKQLEFEVDDKRFKKLGLHIQEKRKTNGQNILLAGLSEKGAFINGYQPYEWEKRTIAEIKKHTDRPIIYRPKPSWRRARPILGTIFSSRLEPLEKVLANTHCVVSHHSNVNTDAMLLGIPAYTKYGVAKDLCYGMDELDGIEEAKCPSYEERYNLFCKMSYCQWNLDEMRSGEAWRWFRGNIYRE